MGISDTILFSPKGLYSKIRPDGKVALLGFSDNSKFSGDCYDLKLKNWNINTPWQLKKKYDTIICLRCAYFAENPEDFIKRCYESLNDGGRLYVDWGLGDHWRFNNFKVGWTKDGEHEYCYGEDNFLWSTVWDDSLLKDFHVQGFQNEIKKNGYESLKKAVKEEVPQILSFNFIEEYFDFFIDAFYHSPNSRPQLYVLLSGVKK